MWRGRSVCGKKVRSGSGKIGTKTLATAKSGSADGGHLERREGSEPLDDAVGQREERASLRGTGLPHDYGDARVAPFARVHLQRNAREERHAVLLGDPIPAPIAEDGVRGARVRRDELAHVLDH